MNETVKTFLDGKVATFDEGPPERARRPRTTLRERAASSREPCWKCGDRDARELCWRHRKPRITERGRRRIT